MKELENPATPFYQNIPNFDEIIFSIEDSVEEDYHMVTGANRQPHRQSSQNPQVIITRHIPVKWISVMQRILCNS